MTPKKKILVIASSIVAVTSAFSVDYYLFMRPTVIKCEISPIPDLPTAKSLLIQIAPKSYMSRLSTEQLIQVDAWWEPSRYFYGDASAFFSGHNPLPELAEATGMHVVRRHGSATGFEYRWGTQLVKNDPDTNHVQIPAQDGHVYTFNEVETAVSREDGSYTEVIRDSRAGRNPRDEVTVHGKCSKAAEPARKPVEQVL